VKQRGKQPETTTEQQSREQQGPKEQQKTTLLSEILHLLRKVLVLAGLLVLSGIFLFGAARNTDPGMAPAVKSGDLIFYFRLDKQYAASDVAAVKIEDSFQTRRVVAVGGDTVDLTAQGLLVNGYLQQESDVAGETLPYTDGITFPIVLEEDQVFLLGDNREYAADSRLYGAVEASDTLGKIVLILRRRNI